MTKNQKKLSSSDLQNLERKIERGVKRLRNQLSANGSERVSEIVLPKERSKRANTDMLEENASIPFTYLAFSEAM